MFSARHIRFLRWLLTFLIILILGWYAYSRSGEFAVLARVKGIHIFLLIGTIVLNGFASAAQSQILFNTIGAPIGFWESFGLSSVGGAVGLVVPQGTTLTKMIYLNKRYAVPLLKSPVIFLGMLIVFLLIGAMILALNNLVALSTGIRVPTVMWLASGAGIASTMLFLIDIPEHLFFRFGQVGKTLRQFSAGWTALRKSRLCLAEACILQALMFAGSGLINYIAYQSLGLDITLMGSVSLAVFISFLNLVMITPSNLGIQEAAYGYITQLSGSLFLEGVAVSALIRAVSLGSTLILAPVMWYFLFVRLGIHIRLSVRPGVNREGKDDQEHA